MAILGLRALYFALAAMVHRFHYLKYALAAVLVFIGAKIFVSDFLMDGEKFPPALSLGVTFALIAAGIGYSLWKTRSEEHTSELQSLMRTSYAVFCLNKKQQIHINAPRH